MSGWPRLSTQKPIVALPAWRTGNCELVLKMPALLEDAAKRCVPRRKKYNSSADGKRSLLAFYSSRLLGYNPAISSQGIPMQADSIVRDRTEKKRGKF
jgi:hypothetical protein